MKKMGDIVKLKTNNLSKTTNFSQPLETSFSKTAEDLLSTRKHFFYQGDENILNCIQFEFSKITIRPSFLQKLDKNPEKRSNYAFRQNPILI